MNKKGHHLSTFILALSFSGVLMISALFAISSYFSVQTLIEREIAQSFDYRHRILQMKIDEKLMGMQSQLSTLSTSPLLIDAVLKEDREVVEEVLFSLLQKDETKHLDILMLTKEKGVVIGDVSSPLSTLGIHKKELILNSHEAFDRWVLLELGKEEKQSIVFFLSVPVIEPELGRVIGSIHSAISINENVQTARVLKEAADVFELILVYGDQIVGNASGHSYDGLIEKFKSTQSQIIRVGDDVASMMNTSLKSKQGKKLSIISFMKGNTASSLSELYALGALYIIAGALVVSLVIAYMVRRLMNKSSDRLFSFVEEISKGKNHPKFEDGPVTEFNKVGRVVGNMVTRLYENERYLTNLIELANSPIIAWDGEGHITKFNRAAERVFSRKSKDVEGLNIQKVMSAIIFAEDDGKSLYERSIKGSVIDNWEMVATNPQTAQDVNMLWSISPVAFHEDGSVATVLAQGQDMTRQKLAEEELHRVNDELELRVMHRTRAMEEEISERRQIEHELRQSEERFRDIAESASDWFWEMGPDYRFTYMSEKAAVATGVDAEDIIGRTRLELISLENKREKADKWREHDALLRRHEPFQGFEYHILNRDGDEHVLRISGKPIFDVKTAEFKGYRGAGRDVTTQYLQQEEIRIAKDQAESASQAKSEFLSSMSHELRTPLNGILGFAQLLLMGPKADLTQKQKEFVSQIIKAGQHLLDLINEILDLAKIEARKVDVSLEAVEAVHVMNDALDMLGRLAEEHSIKIKNKITQQNLPSVHADFTRLKQILVNLGSNAIKYNRKNGSVTFECQICTDENMMEFSVTDTGNGIPEDQIDTLFIPFNRLGAEFSDVEGTGIGLTITSQLVKLMGGRIGVESTLGQGSRFWVRLPLYAEGLSQNTGGHASTKTIDQFDRLDFEKKVNLLYIEDNPNNRKLMEEALSGIHNIELSTMRTAEEGFSFAKRECPDLIFLDINLPGMDGWALLKLLQDTKETKNIPVVAMTAQAMLSDIERGQAAGFTDYLAKPIDLNEVFNVIHKYTYKSEG